MFYVCANATKSEGYVQETRDITVLYYRLDFV
jgi:hypothetical protein